MTNCPCCSDQMLRQIRHHQTIWFCRHCWQEMPDLTTLKTDSLLRRRSLERSLQQPAAQPLALATQQIDAQPTFSLPQPPTQMADTRVERAIARELESQWQKCAIAERY